MNAETENKESGDQQRKVFELKNLYLKDLSFESPGAPESLASNDVSNWNIHISKEHTSKDNDLWECILRITMRVHFGTNNDSLFVIEAQQAGLFLIQGYDKTELREILKYKSHETLYPFLRETITSILSRAGRQGIVFAPVDFADIYNRISDLEPSMD